MQTIPTMTCTEDALKLGRAMKANLIPLLEAERERLAVLAREQTRLQKWDSAMVVATRGQFMREAMEEFYRQGGRR